MQNILSAFVVLFLVVACGNPNEPDGDKNTSSAGSVASNTSWPYEVTGSVDIVDAGVADSDYASWAVGIVTVGGEELLVEFETSVLEQANIDLDFQFSEPTTLLLGKPNDKHGELSYPVKEIR